MTETDRQPSKAKLDRLARETFEATAPTHREAKALGLRFRHFHRVEFLYRGRPGSTRMVEIPVVKLAGTMVTERVGDYVRVSLVVSNPKDKVVTRASGRALAYKRLQEDKFIQMPTERFLQLMEHTPSLFVTLAAEFRDRFGLGTVPREAF